MSTQCESVPNVADMNLLSQDTIVSKVEQQPQADTNPEVDVDSSKVEQQSQADTNPEVEADTNPEVEVDVDPSNYVPTLPISDHLSFVSASCTCDQLNQMSMIETFLSQNPPEEVSTWLNKQLEVVKLAIKNAEDMAHETNSRLLAERVVHKFKKWGPVRFGSTDRCKRCFYTGSERVDSNDNPITYDAVFEAKLRELAGLEADQIVDNLHIGKISAKRFNKFIHVSNLQSSSSSSSSESSSDEESDE